MGLRYTASRSLRLDRDHQNRPLRCRLRHVGHSIDRKVASQASPSGPLRGTRHALSSAANHRSSETTMTTLYDVRDSIREIGSPCGAAQRAAPERVVPARGCHPARVALRDRLRHARACGRGGHVRVARARPQRVGLPVAALRACHGFSGCVVRLHPVLLLRRTSAGSTSALAAKVEALERREIEDALKKFSGNRTHAADALGLSRQGLLKKMDRFGLS